MSNYVYSKVILPKEVYEKYFRVRKTNQPTDNYSEYNLHQLIPHDIEKRACQDYYIYYNEFHPLIDKGSIVELYFDNRWEYPIRSIVNLFKKCPREDIVWYCFEENDIYISCFALSPATHKLSEKLYFLEDDKEFDKLLRDYLDNDQKYESKPDFTEIEWYYKPEEKPGWQLSETKNLYDFYVDKAAFKEVEEIKSGKVEAKTYTDTKELFDEI